MKKDLMRTENLTNAYAKYLEKKLGKEFYDDVGLLVTAKDDAAFYVNEALYFDIIGEYDVNSLDEFAEVMFRIFADRYCTIEDYENCFEVTNKK